MPPSTVVSRLQRFTATVKDAVFLASLIVTITGVFGTFVFSMVWPSFIEKLKMDLDVATKADLQELKEKLSRLTGDDQIIRMAPGHSYVTEPVAKGEDINLILVASRTERGMSCTFDSATPIFKDGRDIPFAGTPLLPIKQLTLTPERLQISLKAPENLEPGRVGIFLNLKFSCPFGPEGSYVDTFDETDVIFFYLDDPSK